MSEDRFDPARRREILLGPVGYEWSLQRDFAKSKALGGLGGTADAKLNTAIECLLVGFDAPAERLLEMALHWVEAAIETDERPEWYAPSGTEASRYQTRALCNWLLFNRHDADSFARCVEFEDRYLTGTKAGRNKTEVSYTLPAYVDAGAYHRALEIFAATPKLSPPKSSAIRGEGQMSYVVSRHRLGLEYTAAEFAALSTRFLNRNVDAWLDDGQWSTAAEWMKIIHWNEADPPISAKEALLKCYDYLPGREPPAQ